MIFWSQCRFGGMHLFEVDCCHKCKFKRYVLRVPFVCLVLCWFWAILSGSWWCVVLCMFLADAWQILLCSWQFA